MIIDILILFNSVCNTSLTLLKILYLLFHNLTILLPLHLLHYNNFNINFIIIILFLF